MPDGTFPNRVGISEVSPPLANHSLRFASFMPRRAGWQSSGRGRAVLQQPPVASEHDLAKILFPPPCKRRREPLNGQGSRRNDDALSSRPPMHVSFQCVTIRTESSFSFLVKRSVLCAVFGARAWRRCMNHRAAFGAKVRFFATTGGADHRRPGRPGRRHRGASGQNRTGSVRRLFRSGLSQRDRSARLAMERRTATKKPAARRAFS